MYFKGGERHGPQLPKQLMEKVQGDSTPKNQGTQRRGPIARNARGRPISRKQARKASREEKKHQRLLYQQHKLQPAAQGKRPAPQVRVMAALAKLAIDPCPMREQFPSWKQ